MALKEGEAPGIWKGIKKIVCGDVINETYEQYKLRLTADGLQLLECLSTKSPMFTGGSWGLTFVYLLIELCNGVNIHTKKIHNLKGVPPSCDLNRHRLVVALQKVLEILESSTTLPQNVKDFYELANEEMLILLPEFEIKESEAHTKEEYDRFIEDVFNAHQERCPVLRKLEQYLREFSGLDKWEFAYDTHFEAISARNVLMESHPPLYNLVLQNGGILPNMWHEACRVYADKVLSIWIEDHVLEHKNVHSDVRPLNGFNEAGVFRQLKGTESTYRSLVTRLWDQLPQQKRGTTTQRSTRLFTNNGAEDCWIALSRNLLMADVIKAGTREDHYQALSVSGAEFMGFPHRTKNYGADKAGKTLGYYANLGMQRPNAASNGEDDEEDDAGDEFVPSGNKCNKTFSHVSGFGNSIFAMCCAYCRKIKVAMFLDQHESPRCLFEIHMRRKDTDQYVVYDFACAAHRYFMAREAQKFIRTIFLIDRLHQYNHIACCLLYLCHVWEKNHRAIGLMKTTAMENHWSVMQSYLSNIRFMLVMNALNFVYAYCVYTNKIIQKFQNLWPGRRE